MDNETLRVLRERRSIRKYKKEQIKDEELDAILEAGTWAASGKNLQTAVMVVVQDQETIQLMSRLNAQIFGRPGTDPFMGRPPWWWSWRTGNNPTGFRMALWCWGT